MKTIAALLTATLLFTTSMVDAQKMYAANAPTVFSRIQNNIKVPEQMKGSVSSEKVRVLFSVDEKGQAHIIEINTSRPEIIASVKQQFEAIDFSNTGTNTNEQYSIWLNFKVI